MHEAEELVKQLRLLSVVHYDSSDLQKIYYIMMMMMYVCAILMMGTEMFLKDC